MPDEKPPARKRDGVQFKFSSIALAKEEEREAERAHRERVESHLEAIRKSSSRWNKVVDAVVVLVTKWVFSLSLVAMGVFGTLVVQRCSNGG